MPSFEVATVDVVIVAVYVLLVLGIGWWVGRKKQTPEGYFLAGRSASWPLIGFALMAANLSGTSYIGLAGAGYHDGIAVWNYEWMAALVLVFFSLFVLPFYLRSRVDTVPEFLERRYDRRSRAAFSVFTVFTAMFVDSAGALFAGAITLQLLFPQVPLWVLIFTIALVGGFYVILGGLEAVMVTDTLQGVLLLVAGGVIFFVGFGELGSWDAVREAAPPGGFTVFKPADDEFLPWPGILTGVVWLGFYYWTTNHVVVQKVLAAKSTLHGRWGVLFAGLTQLPLLFLLILPGVMGRALYPELDSPDQIWPALAFELLPIGLRGLVMAALVAALMSTLDSVLNGAASLVVNDFLKRHERLDDARLLLTSRVVVGAFMIVAALWAPQIRRFAGIVEYFQSFLGYITMPVVVVFLGGLFWRRGTRHAALWTFALGWPIGLAAFIGIELLNWYPLQFLYGTGVMLLFSSLVYVTSSLVTEAPAPERVRDVTWSRRFWNEESAELKALPWWQNHRLLALALIALTIAMVALFA